MHSEKCKVLFWRSNVCVVNLLDSHESNTGLHSHHHDRVAKDHFWCYLLQHEFLVEFDKNQQVNWKTLRSHKQSDLICDLISFFNTINHTIFNSMSSTCPFFKPCKLHLLSLLVEFPYIIHQIKNYFIQLSESISPSSVSDFSHLISTAYNCVIHIRIMQTEMPVMGL
jgi:hypothetical protein